MPRIEIVSHPLCPHAQRLVLIGLLGGKRAGVDYDLTYLPYATLPQTVPRYSPTGELPVLRLDGALASSSTDASAEYLNDVFGLDLLPADPDRKLGIRGEERRVATALDRLRSVFVARDQTVLDRALDGFFDALVAIESSLDAAADPAALTHLGDVALAPMASLASHHALLRDHPRWADLPHVGARVRAWRQNHTVVDAQCPDYAREFDAFFRMTGSALPALASVR